MAIVNDNGMYMPVAPAYGNGGGFGGFGDNGWWIILLLLCGWGGMGMGGFGGMGGLGYDFPWLLNGQNGINANTNAGFDHAATQAALGDLRTAVGSGFGDLQTSLCSGFAGVNATVNGAQNALSQQLYSGEIANLNRSFAEQQANQQGFNGVTSGIADLRYTEATEACATRTAAYQNTRDIIDSQNRGIQTILDKLCQLELDGVKNQLASAQRDNANLQNQVILATERADRTAQTGTIIDGIYNRLASCPIDTTPVYGRQAIFQCPVNVNGNNGGCGCGGYGFAN